MSSVTNNSKVKTFSTNKTKQSFYFLKQEHGFFKQFQGKNILPSNY